MWNFIQAFKNEIMLFGGTWKELEISDRDKHGMFSLM